MFFNEKEDVQIMTGKEEHLNWIKRSLQVCGLAATVKNYWAGATGRYSALLVPAKDEEKGRFLANAYVERCNAQMLLQIDVKEVFGSMVGKSSESEDEIFG